MQVNYKIDGTKLVIEFMPTKTVRDGLKIIYGEAEKQENGMDYIPAFERDLDQGISTYELPEGFDPSLIREVDVAPEAISGEVIGKW